jgi:hypothetical protein
MQSQILALDSQVLLSSSWRYSQHNNEYFFRLVILKEALCALSTQCKNAGLKVAVASSADRIKVDANLAAAGLPVSL